ncbi:MAG TPA: thioredoxin domain-containing protein [Polyangiaceae bacterium]
MQSPWNPYPPQPPPPSRAPWAIIIVVIVVIVMMLGAMGLGAAFFLLRAGTSAPGPSPVVYSPPAITTAAPVPTVVPLPTATTTATAGATATKLYVVPVGSSPIVGRSDALVTLIEFGDFQCPFCKRAAPTIDKLRAEYGADLRVVWKNNPLAFHPNALPAAEMALEARAEKGDATFWKVHDDLYGAGSLDQSSLLLIARANGVSDTKARLAMTSSTYQTSIDADQTLARHVDATGTPTFFINGRMVMGAQPIEKFEVAVEAALKDAKSRVAGGTPRARVYDEIMREAATASP